MQFFLDSAIFDSFSTLLSLIWEIQERGEVNKKFWVGWGEKEVDMDPRKWEGFCYSQGPMTLDLDKFSLFIFF